MADATSSDTGSNALRASTIPRLLQPRWRRVLVAGWLLFAVSFLLPALSQSFEFAPPPPPPPPAASIMTEADAVAGSGSSLMAQGTDLTPGWEAFLFALFGWGGILGIASALTNLLMVATGFHGRWSPRARWPAIALAAAGALNLAYWLWWVADHGESALEIGYYVWVASFALAAIAFRLRCRERTASAAA